MNKNELGQKVFEVSYLRGRFTLRSGKESSEYFDKYQFESRPELLSAIAEHLSALIPDGTEILAGLELGGVPIATALSMRLNIPCVFVRKTAKEYGTCRLAEGVSVVGQKICVIEDVITTGGQVAQSIQELRVAGARVHDVVCVINRNDSKGSNQLPAPLRQLGVHLFSLFSIQDLRPAVHK